MNLHRTKGPFYLYCVTCVVTGKKYVGWTNKSVKERWAVHCLSAARGSKGHLHCAIRKYGSDNFRVRTLETMRSWKLVPDKERQAIARFKTFGPRGYNLTRGGDGTVGFVPPSEQRAKVRAKAKARWATPQFREKMATVIRKEKADVEKFALRGERISARLSTTEAKAVRSKLMKAYWADPKHRAAHDAKMRAHWADPKWAAAHLRALRTPETRAKRSASAKLRWADPKQRALNSARRKKFWTDPKQRAAQSDRAKAQMADPKRLARWKKTMAARRADPKFKAAMSANAKAKWADPKFRAKMKLRDTRMSAYWAQWRAAKAATPKDSLVSVH